MGPCVFSLNVIYSVFVFIRYMKGGADTGFRHVVPEQYTPRLLKFSRSGRQVFMTEVSDRQNFNCRNIYVII